MNKTGNERRAISKNAQQALGEVKRGKKDAAAGKKRKQAVMHNLVLQPEPKHQLNHLLKDQDLNF